MTFCNIVCRMNKHNCDIEKHTQSLHVKVLVKKTYAHLINF